MDLVAQTCASDYWAIGCKFVEVLPRRTFLLRLVEFVHSFEAMKVVCQRELELKDSSGVVKEMLVNVYEPFQDDRTGGDWGCTFSIAGAGIDVSQTMYGVDSMQALLHSIKGLEAHLLYLKRTLAAEITWLGMDALQGGGLF